MLTVNLKKKGDYAIGAYSCFGSSILTYFSFTLWPQVKKKFGSIPDWTSKSSNKTENSCLAGSSVLQPPVQ
jgi:hypothetical protein